MVERIIEVILIIMAVSAVFVAQRAMRKGLTYTATQAVIWTLSILVIAQVWHTGAELGAIDDSFRETVEHTLYIFAYAIFIGLAARTHKLKGR